MTTSPPLSVSALSHLLKQTVETSFADVCLRGEVSAPKKHTSGHLYFTLKDESATIDAICWRPQAMRFEKELFEGAEVICRGRVTTYPMRSKYQLIAEHVTPAGEGALLKLLEARKQKLKAEGLFDLTRKKKIPFLPESIGLITSPTGAVLRDILHRLSDRFPCHVYVWPVAVQGETSATEITRAIQGMNQWSPHLSAPRPSVLIVARGGGSLEDLAAFNEESVVRAAAASEIPLISAVGHETDTTLIDYAADLRAPTPTAAAEFAVPVRHQLLETLAIQEMRLTGYLNRFLETSRLHVQLSAKRLPSIKNKLQTLEQRFDDAVTRLTRTSLPLFTQWTGRLSLLSASLPTPDWVATQGQLRLLHTFSRLTHHLHDILARSEEQCIKQTSILEALSYKKTLARGFCLANLKEGPIVTSAAKTSPGQELQLHFHDGVVESLVNSVSVTNP